MSLKGTKRHLTADDLLRLQEQPSRKRVKTLDTPSTSRLDRTELQHDDSDSDDGNFTEDVLGYHPYIDPEDSGENEDSAEEEDGRTGEKHDREGLNSSSDSDSEETSAYVMPTIDRFASAFRKSNNALEVNPPKSASSFRDLGISSVLQSALASMSIKLPTEVQSACIPPILAGKDCIGNAKTGSGKTIAFALPILQKLLVDPYGIFGLVLTPTRELAFQIAEQFAVLGGSVNVRTAVIVGGMDMMTQALELDNRPHIVIATPGRMVDHLKSTSGNWDLSRVKFLVLDEADRLLTSTFSHELSYLFNLLPQNRQTCLFTATMTASIENLIEAPPRSGKSKPFVHRTKESVETVSTLRQHYILVPSHVREAYLFRILCHPPESTLHLRRAPPEPAKKVTKPKQSKSKKVKRTEEEEIEQPPPTIIFCGRAHTAVYLTSLLKALGIRSTSLHSRLTQRERLASLSLFRASVVPVLVSTDIAARGLDIEDVAIVINWDLPSEPEEYTHRVGRTARAGKGGVAISFVTERDEDRVLRIEERISTKQIYYLSYIWSMTDAIPETQLDEMTLSEEKVLEKLNAVSTAKRLANMELHDSDFGKREEIHKVKNGRRRDRQDDAI
ncbi:ATP-dependent rRNA helicase RRP3 [Coprinopsis sp. MPI-PUGE-AT-0042]|nr:ATP-dependent rRNA helicase RRP3 [Coprinopsis sp. MPI-PUGE-AT-0042]